jgi:hypothetical protein
VRVRVPVERMDSRCEGSRRGMDLRERRRLEEEGEGERKERTLRRRRQRLDTSESGGSLMGLVLARPSSAAACVVVSLVSGTLQRKREKNTHHNHLLPVHRDIRFPEMPQSSDGGDRGAVKEVSGVGEEVEVEADGPDLRVSGRLVV